MSNNHTAPIIRSIRTTLKRAGNIPAPVEQSFKDLDALTAAANFTVPTENEVYEAAAEAILNGRNPFEDNHVRGLAAARSLAADGAFQTKISFTAYDRVATVLTENADAVIDALKKAIDAAGKRLTNSYKILGDVELTDSAAILQRGPEAARAWVVAKDNTKTVTDLLPAWFWMAELTRFANPSLDPSFRLAALDLETVEKVGRKAEAWDIVKAGATIDLATRTTAKDRAAGYARALEARGAHSDGAYARAYRKSHGSAPIYV